MSVEKIRLSDPIQEDHNEIWKLQPFFMNWKSTNRTQRLNQAGGGTLSKKNTDKSSLSKFLNQLRGKTFTLKTN